MKGTKVQETELNTSDNDSNLSSYVKGRNREPGFPDSCHTPDLLRDVGDSSRDGNVDLASLSSMPEYSISRPTNSIIPNDLESGTLLINLIPFWAHWIQVLVCAQRNYIKISIWVDYFVMLYLKLTEHAWDMNQGVGVVVDLLIHVFLLRPHPFEKKKKIEFSLESFAKKFNEN